MDDKNDLYNLPLASFTFGMGGSKTSTAKNNNISFGQMGQSKIPQSSKNLYSTIKKRTLKQNNNLDNNNDKDKDNELNLNNNFFQNSEAQNTVSTKEEACELTFGGNNDIPNDTYQQNINNDQNFISKNKYKNISIFYNSEGGINDSFIYAILYSIHHMKLFRNYIINDLNSKQSQNKNSTYKKSFLYDLQDIMVQMGKNKYIDIHQFRGDLCKEFQNRRKFLIDQPDDPADLLFVIINAIHSYAIQFALNEISDETCTDKCFSHKFIWLDLSRIDECKCKGTAKRLFSIHNYITDIPMKKIFNIIKNSINNGKYLYDSKQKLFNYYTQLVYNIKTDCPANGQRCPINRTFHKLHLANSPSYLIFNLEHDISRIDEDYAYSVMSILKSFVLIPNKFDIWDLFELNSKKNKIDFDFIGCILFKISKVYSCAFKNKKGLMIYYECNSQNNINSNRFEENNDNNMNIIEFISYFDFVVFCIKNGLIPIMLFYQGKFLSPKKKDVMNNYDELLTNDQISNLEKFCSKTDNLHKIIQNKLRNKENLISQMNPNLKIKANTSINLNQNNQSNDKKMNISNQSIFNFSSNITLDEYNCYNCKFKNKVINKICIKCGFDNNDFFMNNINPKNKKIKNKRFSYNISKNMSNSQGKQVLNSSSINKSNIKTNHKNMIIQLSKRKKLCISPDIKHKDNKKFLENYNFETYDGKRSFISEISKKKKKNGINLF